MMSTNYVENWDTKRFEFITYRKRNNIKQKDLSRYLHVSSNVISCIELGYVTPTISFMNEMNNVVKRLIELKNEQQT